MKNKLIVVDINDRPIGEISKTDAHAKGILHRAFSVFIFNTEGKWLLQKRALHKYHSAGLWSNTCCGHPNVGEETTLAAEKRLFEEMGMHVKVNPIFEMTYRAVLKNGLIEHEFDHIFTGISDDMPIINNDEVISYQYLSNLELREKISANPEEFTEWFKMLFERVVMEVEKG